MPLRDHFHPPLDDRYDGRSFLAGWPAMIVVDLSGTLPHHYAAEPRVQLSPDAALEVRVFDRERKLQVAAVEIISPANKDRPEHRAAFVAKCAALLQQRVSIAVIDLVTTRDFNLYADLLELIDRADPSLGAEPPPLYAVACRPTRRGKVWHLEAWAHSLALGQPLPTLPLWLVDNLAVPLELEATYEETCRILRIP